MARVKGAMMTRKRRNKILKMAKSGLPAAEGRGFCAGTWNGIRQKITCKKTIF